jgi:hypothetical protein
MKMIEVQPSRCDDDKEVDTFPALKRRAKFMPALRAENPNTDPTALGSVFADPQRTD